MYERFTDRSRKVMQLANQEAMRFNHEYIDTQHILLGLIKEGSGVASEILKGMNIDLRSIRIELDKMTISGPDIPLMGKLPHTPASMKVIECSIEAARQRGDGYVGTFHILLGLIREEKGIAATILKNHSVTEIIVVDAEKNWVNKKQLEVVVDVLEIEKEEAVMKMDFQKARLIQDQIDKEVAQKILLSQIDKIGDELVQQEEEVFGELLNNQKHIISLLDKLLAQKNSD